MMVDALLLGFGFADATLGKLIDDALQSFAHAADAAREAFNIGSGGQTQTLDHSGGLLVDHSATGLNATHRGADGFRATTTALA